MSQNLFSRKLSKQDLSVLRKGVNYNLGNLTPREYLAEFEHAFYSSGFPLETRFGLRQLIVPALYDPTIYLKGNMPHQMHSRMTTISSCFQSELEGYRLSWRKPAMFENQSSCSTILTPTVCWLQIWKLGTGNWDQKYLKKLQIMQRITKEERWRNRRDSPNIALFYGMPKVHKEGISLRPIVSLPLAPIYNLAMNNGDAWNPDWRIESFHE